MFYTLVKYENYDCFITSLDALPVLHVVVFNMMRSCTLKKKELEKNMVNSKVNLSNQKIIGSSLV